MDHQTDSVRTLDNATAAIIDALTSSDLIESATVEIRTRSTDDGADKNFDRLKVCGRLRVDPSAKFVVQLDIS